MAVSKECISLAAEFAVASELCRKGVYAQLTFGNKKRTDILIMSDNNVFIKIEVKAKQGATWPNCKGIFGNQVFLILVDYAKLNEDERPVFYILNVDDWLQLVKKEIKRIKDKNPEKRIEIDSENVPVNFSEVNKYGQPYKGIGISPNIIQEHKEAWDKISNQIVTS